MAEYISREAFAAEMKSRQDAAEEWLIEATGTEDAYGKARAEAILSFLCEVKLTLDAIPAADVVPVVRCKDCKHYDDGWCHRVHNPAQYSKIPDDWFCADGEKREAEHD